MKTLNYLVVGKIVLMLIVLVLVVFFVVEAFITYRVNRAPEQTEFLRGRVPSELPDGFYRGSVKGYTGDWRGKQFTSTSGQGVNIFNQAGTSTERYPFDFYKASGLQDPIPVIAINYNRKGNPLWVRFIFDEMVEISPRRYLGKIHIRILPGLAFTIGYFRLEQ